MAPPHNPRHGKPPFRTWPQPISAGNMVFGLRPPACRGEDCTRRNSDLASPGVERLADDQNPNLTPWAATQLRMHNDLVKNGHRAFSRNPAAGRAAHRGNWRSFSPSFSSRHRNEVWMIWERDHQVRRVYLNREHSRKSEALVVWRVRRPLRQRRACHRQHRFHRASPELCGQHYHTAYQGPDVVERWKLNEQECIEAIVTVDDPRIQAPGSGSIGGRRSIAP